MPFKPKNKDQSSVKRKLAWWKEQIGDYSIASVTPDVISDQKAKLRARKNRYGEPFTPATLNRYLAAISHVFKIAKNEWHWIERSPLENVSRGEESKGRVRFLADDERERLLTACKESRNGALHQIVVLALSTGMRKGEILGLRWKDIDFKRRLITLEDTKNSDR